MSLDLFHPKTIRERASLIFDLCKSGETHFNYHPDLLPELAKEVASETKENYPDLSIPFHSRWGHFQVGGIDRLAELDLLLLKLNPIEKAKSKFDLAVTSVLLDAGAGPKWSYQENSVKYTRSEGLALASLRAFLDGAFSSDPNSNPYQANASVLFNLKDKTLALPFQHDPVKNPLVGFDGRVALLKSLGRVLEQNTKFFGSSNSRPGDLINYFLEYYPNKILPASEILRAIQLAFGEIWPGRITLKGVNLGDVWNYPPLGQKEEALVPFHKLVQWLTYSLVEPLEEFGFRVQKLNELTALAEYRNGGLLVDFGVITPKNPSAFQEEYTPNHPLIIEWRALTLAIFDELAPLIRKELQQDQETLPMVKILQGGTWSAGRKLAFSKRVDGSPPFKLKSDGTVF